MLTLDEIKELEMGLVRSLQGGRIDYYNTTTLMWNSYIHGTVGIYNGSMWVPVTPPSQVNFVNNSYDINGSSLVAGKNYDVFARYQNEQTFSLALAPWTSNTSRVSELSRFEGVLVYNTTTSGKQMRYLGTIRTDSSINFVDSATQRFVVNWDNCIMKCVNTYNSSYTDWTWSSTTWQEFRAGSSQVKGEFLLTRSGSSFMSVAQAYISADSSQVWLATALNSTTAYSGKDIFDYVYGNSRHTIICHTYISPVLGYNYITMLAKNSSSSSLYGGQDHTRGIAFIYT